MAESMKGLTRSFRCTEISKENVGSEVTVMGWVQKSRNTGGLIFVDLRDRSGILQIAFNEEKVSKEVFDKAYRI
ncbi:MAG: Asp-tRNA(Asn)/Glu-tRNA(Gln) amidotransferase GatCAB subunit C, partial [Lachnospiraceae bacterium]|nr:Asp-tRNA(Asn)/Glu-tRNA(Gln) amidotransferase GatCAB subunit C [Lachnospiraceae bacterium]